MTAGYYDEDHLWVAPYEAHQDEERLENLLRRFSQPIRDGHFVTIDNGSIMNDDDREFLIEHGYDPDTGEEL